MGVLLKGHYNAGVGGVTASAKGASEGVAGAVKGSVVSLRFKAS